MTLVEKTEPLVAMIDSLLTLLEKRRKAGDQSSKLTAAIDGALDERLRLIELTRPCAVPIRRRATRSISTIDDIVQVESTDPLTDDAVALIELLSAGDLLAGSIRIEDLETRYKAWMKSEAAASEHTWPSAVIDQAAVYYLKRIIREISHGRLTILRSTAICYEVRLARVSNDWSSATALVFEPIA